MHTELVSGGDVVTVGEMRFKIIDCPGHTHGHIMYHLDGEPGALFTGDALFQGELDVSLKVMQGM